MEPDGRRAARPLAGRSFLSAGRRAAAAARPHARRGADGGRAGAAFPLFDGKPGPEALVLRGLAGAVPAGAHPVAAAGVVFCSVRVNGGGRRTPARLSVAAGRACYIFAAERYCAAVGIRVCARRKEEGHDSQYQHSGQQRQNGFCIPAHCNPSFKKPISRSSGLAQLSSPITTRTVKMPSIAASGSCVGAKTPKKRTALAAAPPSAAG